MLNKMINNLNNAPTQEEIDAIISYFKETNEIQGYNLYIRELVEKHGYKWVDNALATVIQMISLQQ